MVALNTALYKYLAASGAVTTNNKAGILHKVVFSGATVGDSLTVLDGAATILVLLTEVANKQVEFKPPVDKRPTFTTDIDATISNCVGDSTNVWVNPLICINCDCLCCH